MTTLDRTILATPSIKTRPAIATRTVKAVAAFYRAWKNRRAFYQLGNMSDAELADIGLVRSDLYLPVLSPFNLDPTARLGALARNRAEQAEKAARRIC